MLRVELLNPDMSKTTRGVCHTYICIYLFMCVCFVNILYSCLLSVLFFGDFLRVFFFLPIWINLGFIFPQRFNGVFFFKGKSYLQLLLYQSSLLSCKSLKISLFHFLPHSQNPMFYILVNLSLNSLFVTFLFIFNSIFLFWNSFVYLFVYFFLSSSLSEFSSCSYSLFFIPPTYIHLFFSFSFITYFSLHIFFSQSHHLSPRAC